MPVVVASLCGEGTKPEEGESPPKAACTAKGRGPTPDTPLWSSPLTTLHQFTPTEGGKEDMSAIPPGTPPQAHFSESAWLMPQTRACLDRIKSHLANGLQGRPELCRSEGTRLSAWWHPGARGRRPGPCPELHEAGPDSTSPHGLSRSPRATGTWGFPGPLAQMDTEDVGVDFAHTAPSHCSTRVCDGANLGSGRHARPRGTESITVRPTLGRHSVTRRPEVPASWENGHSVITWGPSWFPNIP